MCIRDRTNIYLQTVGMVYPISTYISNWIILSKLLAAYIQYNWIFYKNVHFPTLCPKGTQKPQNLHSSSKLLAWYIKYQLTYSTVTYPPNCWHRIFNTNLHLYVHFHRNHQSQIQATFVAMIQPISMYNVHCTMYNWHIFLILWCICTFNIS